VDRRIVALLVVLVSASVPLAAHHSWIAFYTDDKPMVLRGALAKVELVNPHGWLWVDVKNADGTTTRWGIEGGSLDGLARNGITKGLLTPGETLTVHGYGARNGSNLIAGVRFERADGSQFSLANEGAEAAAKARGNLQ
jgi:hypothetical protein